MALTSYIVENDEAFNLGIERLRRATNDFSIPFGLIAKDFYRSNKKIFSLKGPGKYPVLGGFNPQGASGFGTQTRQERAETLKERQVGFIYPLLVRDGKLASSLLNPGDGNAIRVVGKQTLQLGTDVEYAKFHQSDDPRSTLPQRKVLFIDGGPLETSQGGKNGRRESWLNIINQYIIDRIDEAGK